MWRTPLFIWIFSSSSRSKHRIIRFGSTESSLLNTANPNCLRHFMCSSFSMCLFLKDEMCAKSVWFSGLNAFSTRIAAEQNSYLSYAIDFSAASFMWVDRKSISMEPGHVEGAINWPVGLTHKGPASLRSWNYEKSAKKLLKINIEDCREY